MIDLLAIIGVIGILVLGLILIKVIQKKSDNKEVFEVACIYVCVLAGYCWLCYQYNLGNSFSFCLLAGIKSAIVFLILTILLYTIIIFVNFILKNKYK